MHINTASFRRGNFGMLAVHMAALNGYMTCLKRLLKDARDLDADTPDDFGRTCLHAAACGGLVKHLSVWFL